MSQLRTDIRIWIQVIYTMANYATPLCNNFVCSEFKFNIHVISVSHLIHKYSGFAFVIPSFIYL